MSATRPTRRPRDSADAPDAGFTLPELVVAVSVMSVLLTAISAALISMLNISTDATTRLSETADIGFVQTRFPVDLGAAQAASDLVATADVVADLTAQLNGLGLPVPSLSGLSGLPGTNALTIVRPDTSGATLVISYRYQRDGDGWVLTRHQLGGGATQVNVVATELAPPPSELDPSLPAWQPGDPIDFAIQVRPKVLATSRPAGRDIELTFASGRTFRTGGAGLSVGDALPPADYPDLVDPLAPPSRCGKRVAIIIDTSGSVPQGSGGRSTESAAVGFIDGFVGTPTTISINGFDQTGYGMSIDFSNPATRDQRAPFYSVLNESSQVQGMRNRITALDDTDGQWANGVSLLSPAGASNPKDPNGDGIYWGQVGDGTNWEGGLWNVFRDPTGAIYASDQPDLVVFITDGQPNIRRSGPGAIEGAVEADASAAATAASTAMQQQLGTRIVGVMVGDKTTNPTYRDYLNAVAPGPEWNGQVNGDGSVDVGNAATAGIFLGGFDELGGILRSIVIGECGGTVTLQKRIDSGAGPDPAPSGVWSYTSNVAGDVSSRALDVSLNSSTTFDYSFAPAEATKTVQLTEQPVDGLVWERAECTASGAPVPTTPNADGTPGVTVTVAADEAVSCLMISRPA